MDAYTHTHNPDACLAPLHTLSPLWLVGIALQCSKAGTVLCTLPPQVCSAHGPRGRLFPSPTSWFAPRTLKGQRDVTGLWNYQPHRKADPSRVEPFPQDCHHPAACGVIAHSERLLHPQGIRERKGEDGETGGLGGSIDTDWNLFNETSTAWREKGYKTPQLHVQHLMFTVPF